MKHLTLAVFSVLATLTISGPGYAHADVFDDVPEAAGYSLVYDLSIPANISQGWNTSPVPYTVDNSASIADGFSRVAYYLKLNSQFVFVSFNAAGFANKAGKLGVPVTGTGVIYQQNLTNMNVQSNVAGIVTGVGLTTGNIEFWPSNYSASNDLAVPNANNGSFDFGDGGASLSAGYGSMQIHNHQLADSPTSGQVLFAFNRWGTGGNLDLGIGNRPGTGDTDWTFAQNSASYSIRQLQILVQQVPEPSITAVGLLAALLGTARRRREQP